MRDFKGIKRQRNRNRNGGGGGGGKPQHNANRAFDSNGPDGVKVRGAAQHVYEKYQQLARDAHTAGDRVLAENHLQHAEHYFRVMRAMQPQRPLADIVGRDQFVSGYDIDFEDESAQAEAAEGEIEGGEGEGERAEARSGEDRAYRGEDRFDQRQDRPYRSRDDRFRDNRDNRGPRDDRDYRGPRDDRARFDRQDRPDRPEYRDRNDRDRPEYRDRPDRDRPEYRDRNERDRFEREPRPYRAEGAEPRPVEPTEPAQVLRADDGDVSHAPAFLQARPPEAEPGAGETRRTRRRRGPRQDADLETPESGDET